VELPSEDLAPSSSLTTSLILLQDILSCQQSTVLSAEIRKHDYNKVRRCSTAPKHKILLIWHIRCYGDAVGLQLIMERQKWVGINTSPHSEVYLCFELGLIWGAYTRGGILPWPRFIPRVSRYNRFAESVQKTELAGCLWAIYTVRLSCDVSLVHLYWHLFVAPTFPISHSHNSMLSYEQFLWAFWAPNKAIIFIHGHFIALSLSDSAYHDGAINTDVYRLGE